MLQDRNDVCISKYEYAFLKIKQRNTVLSQPCILDRETETREWGFCRTTQQIDDGPGARSKVSPLPVQSSFSEVG